MKYQGLLTTFRPFSVRKHYKFISCILFSEMWTHVTTLPLNYTFPSRGIALIAFQYYSTIQGLYLSLISLEYCDRPDVQLNYIVFLWTHVTCGHT